MNAQQADNLRILIRHMETKVTRVLEMRFYFDGCGTPGCALGEATCIPALARAGLSQLRRDDGVPIYPTNETAVFGLRDADRDRLFGTPKTCAWGRNDVTPLEWGVEARRVLAENGYSMDDAAPAKVGDDGFSAFLAKLREPVALDVATERL